MWSFFENPLILYLLLELTTLKVLKKIIYYLYYTDKTMWLSEAGQCDCYIWMTPGLNSDLPNSKHLLLTTML